MKGGDTKYLAGHYYHVYNRGCSRQRIFVNEGNYLFLLRRAKTFLAEYPLTVIAYCLLPSHYHFLFRPEEDGVVSPFLQRLFNSYTQAFNRQQTRGGTLFQGRPKGVLVDTEAYVVHLCRYIHLNPVDAGLVVHPGDWPYSNYLEWAGKRRGTLVDHSFIQRYFLSPTDYEAFIAATLDEELKRKLEVYYLDSRPCEGF